MSRKLLLLAGLVAGCAPGEGALVVALTADAPLDGVDHVKVIVVVNKTERSQPAFVYFTDAPVMLGDTPRDFQLRFDKSRSGTATLQVTAFDSAKDVLASGMGAGTIAPSQESTVSVVLHVPNANGGDAGTTDDGGVTDDGASDDGGVDAAAVDAGPGSWTAQSSGSSMYGLNAIWGSGAGDVYVVGNNGVVLHSTGSGDWTPQTTNGAYLTAVWGSGAGDVYAVGSAILHSGNGGASWDVEVASPSSILRGIWGSGPRDVYAVGEGGLILHGDGTSGGWTPQTSNVMDDLHGVWGASAGEVWAVGVNGALLRGDGAGNWSAGHVAGDGDFNAVWGTGASDLYVGGMLGIYHSSDGGQTLVTQSGTDNSLWSFWGAGSVVFCAGYTGTMLVTMNGGAQWNLEAVPTNANLRGVWGSGLGDVYVVGDNGTILHQP